MAEGEGWKRLGSERLMENPYFSLRSDRLRLPDGGIKDPYYVIERPDAAIIFPLTAERARSSSSASTVRRSRGWSSACPPGSSKRARGRRPRPAASCSRRRATRAASGSLWAPLASSPSLKDNWAYLFLARGVEETAPPDPDEHELVEVVRVSVKELLDLVRSGEIVSSSGVAAIMLALERLRGP